MLCLKQVLQLRFLFRLEQLRFSQTLLHPSPLRDEGLEFALHAADGCTQWGQRCALRRFFAPTLAPIPTPGGCLAIRRRNG